MEDVYDVVVVGGGVIGSACARHLTLIQPDAKLAVVAPEEPTGSYAEHNGMFASHYDEGRVTRILDPNPVWARLAKHSIARYRDLEAESGIPFYHEAGYVCIGSEQHSAYLERVQAVADAASVTYDRLDAAQLHARFPAMPPADAPGQQALRALAQTKDAGHISPRKMVQAQLRVCEQHGVHVVRDYATSVSFDADTNLAVVHLASSYSTTSPSSPPSSSSTTATTATATPPLRARKVVVATGAFTTRELTDGVQVPLDVEGRTVVFADVTDMMQTAPDLQLDRLPSVIKAISSNADAKTEAEATKEKCDAQASHDTSTGAATKASNADNADETSARKQQQQQQASEQATAASQGGNSSTGMDSEQAGGNDDDGDGNDGGGKGARGAGPCYDMYCLPPVKYGDGRWYIKIGTGDFPNKLPTLADVVAWFKGPPSKPDVAMLTRELLALYPPLTACTMTTANCVLTYTPHGYPVIDWVRSGVIAVAAGGNGAAAKSGDEIGRLAACFVSGQPDPTYDMATFALP
ncbi:hypothetical protein PTSG_12619 [Salpingoeca rosetta]|uniref:FAD dependent oxidoreductase domain-containing protein n=1 Tax=Salpingoeca rosetta (strain ATCC 50818 / BSB-021) TaxID=946362 RepID=F2UHH9_SALR5|nr:uncharacterized protein PTSG_12619 [Salpingoeca rosetta]EGD76578.1 hypothetical protein PTSG_12619 [Salpingoeca rosetta]|eukprot:XP_004991492.1 hypothetical protein PTSG_12619 [Salpingoeca rosetta]